MVTCTFHLLLNFGKYAIRHVLASYGKTIKTKARRDKSQRWGSARVARREREREAWGKSGGESWRDKLSG